MDIAMFIPLWDTLPPHVDSYCRLADFNAAHLHHRGSHLCNFGPTINTVIAMVIATIKATMVVLFYAPVLGQALQCSGVHRFPVYRFAIGDMGNDGFNRVQTSADSGISA